MAREASRCFAPTLTEQQGVSLSIGPPSALFCVSGLREAASVVPLAAVSLRLSMRSLVSITFAVGCSLAMSGCSRWCSCAAQPPPLAPQQYGQGTYSDSYEPPPQGNSYERSYSDSDEQQQPSNSDPYLASPPNRYGRAPYP